MTDLDLVARLAKEASLPGNIAAHPAFKHFTRLMLAEFAHCADDCALLCGEVAKAASFDVAGYQAARLCQEAIRARFVHSHKPLT